jgi:hypothetical protein
MGLGTKHQASAPLIVSLAAMPLSASIYWAIYLFVERKMPHTYTPRGSLVGVPCTNEFLAARALRERCWLVLVSLSSLSSAARLCV